MSNSDASRTASSAHCTVSPSRFTRFPACFTAGFARCTLYSLVCWQCNSHAHFTVSSARGPATPIRFSVSYSYSSIFCLVYNIHCSLPTFTICMYSTVHDCSRSPRCVYMQSERLPLSPIRRLLSLPILDAGRCSLRISSIRRVSNSEVNCAKKIPIFLTLESSTLRIIDAESHRLPASTMRELQGMTCSHSGNF
jgi:hypothetical protein